MDKPKRVIHTEQRDHQKLTELVHHLVKDAIDSHVNYKAEEMRRGLEEIAEMREAIKALQGEMATLASIIHFLRMGMEVGKHQAEDTPSVRLDYFFTCLDTAPTLPHSYHAMPNEDLPDVDVMDASNIELD